MIDGQVSEASSVWTEIKEPRCCLRLWLGTNRADVTLSSILSASASPFNAKNLTFILWTITSSKVAGWTAHLHLRAGNQGSHLLTLAPRPLKTSWKLQPCAKQIPSSRSTYLPSQKKSTSRYPDHHATCHVLPCCKQSSAGFSLGGWGHQTVEGCAATKEIRVGEAEWQDHNKSSLFLAFPFTRFPSGLKWNSRNHEDRFVPD